MQGQSATTSAAQQDTQQAQQLAQQLRDIHLPEAVSWWPPAIGWWLLTLLCIGLLWVLWANLKKRRKAKEYRIAAHIELSAHYNAWLKHNTATLYLQSASEVLKRIMRHIDNDSEALSTSGQAWLDALNSRTDEPLSAETQAALSQQVYQRNAVLDIPAVHKELLSWVDTHQAKMKVQLKEQADA
ncbi:MAG: DUF4381 domain-containing protein [Pseudomonadales bacterium]